MSLFSVITGESLFNLNISYTKISIHSQKDFKINSNLMDRSIVLI